MKKMKWGRVIAALAIITLAASCSSSSGGEPDDESNNGNETATQTPVETPVETPMETPVETPVETPAETPVEEVIPAGFVKVTGATVTGGTKFAYAGSSEDWFKGVFREGRSVTIADFYMCDHEVTQEEYQAVMGNNPSYFKGINAPATGETQTNRPVESVSWYDAIVYCNKKSIADNLNPCYTINGKTNPSEWGTIPESSDDTWNAVICDFTKNGYRLPTEAEWEYAARGGKAGCEAADPNNWAGTDDSSDLETYAWYYDSKTHEVKKKTKNSLNIYDMSGNVWEWCWDWYDSTNTSSITSSTPATGVAYGSYRVNRGGSWYFGAEYCSVALRSYDYPGSAGDNLGFRVVRSSL